MKQETLRILKPEDVQKIVKVAVDDGYRTGQQELVKQVLEDLDSSNVDEERINAVYLTVEKLVK